MPHHFPNENFFTRQLLHWHHSANQREMPWKNETDPYRIWLSETMLQQTRVEQGRGYYLRFLQKFPDLPSLAAAPADEVLKLWEGLGYYSRCHNLMAAARQVMDEHGGIFPSVYPAILALKGVGPYTAAAIASFAFGLPYAVVDGNVIRILSRYFGIHTPLDTSAGKKEFGSLAQQLLNKEHPAAFNQAIMDFGATVCKPKNPLCSTCPLVQNCIAFQQGLLTLLPARSKTMVKKDRQFYYAIVGSSRGWLVQQRGDGDIWKGLYQFVMLPAPAGKKLTARGAQQLAAGHTGLDIKSARALPIISQQLTHQSLQLHCYLMECNKPRTVKHHQWVQQAALGQLAFPRQLAIIVHRYLTSDEAGRRWQKELL